MEPWITPPAHFERNEGQPQTWMAEDKSELLNPMLKFGPEAPLRANLRVMRENVELPTDIDVVVSQYCRTLGERFSSPSNYNVAVANITFEDQNEGRMLNVMFPKTKGLFPVQMLAFRLDNEQLTTAIFTTEKSLVTDAHIKEIGEVLRTLKAPN